ncbi:MAG: ATP-dependent Clp protease proteolytic subunit [Patescibacteria group bacterium]|jgi:ATP-dependent protease ClpP protease subunit
MANWKNILEELNANGSNFDIIRRSYLKKLSKLTGRNVIAYYSGWLQKNAPDLRFSLSINDNDKNGFMNALAGVNCSKGLDLVLHTPGGDVAATESIIDYLKSKFEDIRVIVPQLAMSGGTMIACCASRIIMGKHSSLGPIDPQIGGLPAHGVVEEFLRAYEEIKADPVKQAVWAPIIQKYHPTFIGECEKAIEWSQKIAENCLRDRMFKGQADANEKVKKIIDELTDHSISLSHSRHLSFKKCSELGFMVDDLESDSKLQDAVLSVHHSFIHTLTSTPAIKIIENHNGVAFIQSVPQYLMNRN